MPKCHPSPNICKNVKGFVQGPVVNKITCDSDFQSILLNKVVADKIVVNITTGSTTSFATWHMLGFYFMLDSTYRPSITNHDVVTELSSRSSLKGINEGFHVII